MLRRGTQAERTADRDGIVAVNCLLGGGGTFRQGDGETAGVENAYGHRGASNFQTITYGRVYIAVRNKLWYAVMPPSVSLGRSGRGFHCNSRLCGDRLGSRRTTVPGFLVSGKGAAGPTRHFPRFALSNSVFRQLPPQFKGPYIELRFTYYYNLRPTDPIRPGPLFNRDGQNGGFRRDSKIVVIP